VAVDVQLELDLSDFVVVQLAVADWADDPWHGLLSDALIAGLLLLSELVDLLLQLADDLLSWLVLEVDLLLLLGCGCWQSDQKAALN